jgi:hypothetical protein
MGEERRLAPRHFFSAEAELVDPRTQVRVVSRVGDISLHGCYLDMRNPFPADTEVQLKITAGHEVFQTRTKIVYAIPNVGAGARFVDVESKDQALLERWLRAAQS